MKDQKRALGRRPGVIPRHRTEPPENPPQSVGPGRILVMGGPEDDADQRPIGRGNDWTQRGEPHSDGGLGRPRREHGGCLPYKRRTLLWQDRGTSTWNRGWYGMRGCRWERHGPASAASRRSGTRWAGQLPPRTTVGVLQQQQARRQRRANGDGWTVHGQARPRRHGEHQPSSGAATAAGRLAMDAADVVSTGQAAGCAGDAADGAPTGLSGGVAGDGFLSAERHVVQRGPRRYRVGCRLAVGGARGATTGSGWRRRRRLWRTGP